MSSEKDGKEWRAGLEGWFGRRELPEEYIQAARRLRRADKALEESSRLSLYIIKI